MLSVSLMAAFQLSHPLLHLPRIPTAELEGYLSWRHYLSEEQASSSFSDVRRAPYQ